MKKCLVLGGTGFIGSHLVEALLAQGHEVRVFSKSEKEFSRDVETMKGDFLNEKELEKSLQDIDYLFHFISITRQGSPADPALDINASLRLFDLAVKNGIKKVIFSSSGGTVYGEPVEIPLKETAPTNPISQYGASKLAIEGHLEDYLREHDLEHLILRYSNPYGEGQNPNKQGIIPIFLTKIMKGEQPVIYGDGSAIRDYIYIKDAIEATLLPLHKSKHRIYNVGSATGTSINEAVKIISEVTGQEITSPHLERRSTDVSRNVLDVSRLREEFGWEPKVSLREGIEKTWEWIQK